MFCLSTRLLLALAGLARIGAGGQRVENAAQKYLASRAGPLVRMAVWPVHSGDHRRFPIKTITCRAIKIKFSAVKSQGSHAESFQDKTDPDVIKTPEKPKKTLLLPRRLASVLLLLQATT